MDSSKKIFSVLFYIALCFEFLFNLLVFFALFYYQVNKIIVASDLAVLIIGSVLSLIFALRQKWGITAITSCFMGVVMVGFAYYYLSHSMDTALFWKNHLHIIVPGILAVITWRIDVSIKRRNEDREFAKRHSGKIS